MANPCEVLLDGGDRFEAERIGTRVAREARRIEHKYSRYLRGNIVDRINSAQGRPVRVDEETRRLLDYATRCWELSEGRFDLTAGVLRRAWTFNGSDHLPGAAAVAALLPLVGWQRVDWNGRSLRLRPGMEIDFGGVGKEYAVDRALMLAMEISDAPILLNFGGDLACSSPRRDGRAWRVGIESSRVGQSRVLDLMSGALATSGDARRYLEKDGIRYPHILDPRSGWPVMGAPNAVTVAAADCSQAGFLATLAMLHGRGASALLMNSGHPHWVQARD